MAICKIYDVFDRICSKNEPSFTDIINMVKALDIIFTKNRKDLKEYFLSTRKISLGDYEELYDIGLDENGIASNNDVLDDKRGSQLKYIDKVFAGNVGPKKRKKKATDNRYRLQYGGNYVLKCVSSYMIDDIMTCILLFLDVLQDTHVGFPQDGSIVNHCSIMIHLNWIAEYTDILASAYEERKGNSTGRNKETLHANLHFFGKHRVMSVEEIPGLIRNSLKGVSTGVFLSSILHDDQFDNSLTTMPNLLRRWKRKPFSGKCQLCLESLREHPDNIAVLTTCRHHFCIRCIMTRLSEW